MRKHRTPNLEIPGLVLRPIPECRNLKLLERAHRKIAQPQIGVAAFFPDPEQRPVQRLAQEIVALAHRDADALAEIAALDERPAGEGAAFTRIRAVDPEGERDGVAEDQVDLAAAKRCTQ